MKNDNPPVWFITGCSTGLGRELAVLLLDKGYRVAATARDVSQIDDLARDHPDTALAMRLDVTDKSTITQAVKETESRFGQIDVLVNNAGYGYLAAIEEGEEDAVRKLFDTNVFGLIDVTKAVLPGMRKRQSGHILNISSIGGLVSFAATGYYHATKFAVEGLSGTLATELAPLNIKVTAVEPGPFRTDWAGRSLKTSNIEIDDYAQTAGARREKTKERSGNQPGDPARAAQAMIDAVASNNPPQHLLLGKPALEMARKELDRKKQDYDTWEDVTLSADFPGATSTLSKDR